MIEVKSLTKTYGDGDAATTVVDGIDFAVARGDIAAVIGPSGAGKSTLARCINLLVRPTSGHVYLDGQDLTSLRGGRLRDASRSMGTIFQASSLLRRSTARQNVELPLEFAGVSRKERKRRSDDLLDRVGVVERADAYPHELSGGQRQRVGIARALALNPIVLLADEPTSGLDPETTQSVLDLIRELKQDLGLTVLLITHEMDVARRLADWVALMEHGRIVEKGTVTDLLSSPRSAVGDALLPWRTHREPGAGRVVLKLTYQADVTPDWVSRFVRELDASLELLSGGTEAIRGVSVGRVLIATDAPVDRSVTFLRSHGLHAETADGTEAS